MKTLTQQEAKKLLKEYDENEDNNCHAENYLLLAEAYGDDEDKRIAEDNLRVKSRGRGVNSDLSSNAHEAVSHFYYYAKKDAGEITLEERDQILIDRANLKLKLIKR